MVPQGYRFTIEESHNEVLGAVRKKPHDDRAFQAQIDALPTIGRLIREKRLEAFTYNELRCEKVWQFIGEPAFDAMAGCAIQSCPPAVERSRFYQGHYLTYARKGGKKDRKSGVRTTIGQIQFMQMLCNLKEDFLPQWMPFVKTLGLTAFEIESMVNLKCFQSSDCRGLHRCPLAFLLFRPGILSPSSRWAGLSAPTWPSSGQKL